jgi:hypothetical protein
MPKYLLAFHGSRIPDPASEQTELTSAWKSWMAELGDALEGSNNPMKLTRTISADGAVSDGGGPNPVVGLSFITANDMDTAIRVAKTCPHLAAGGSIEVAELPPKPLNRTK